VGILRASSPRRGIMVVVALICLLIASILTTALVKRALVERRQVAFTWAAAQADWLVESGRQRAMAKLRADPAYGGETWLPPDAAGGRPTGEVRILVEWGPQGQAAGTLVISAICPGAGGLPCRRERAINLRHLPRAESADSPGKAPADDNDRRGLVDPPAMP
jgi:hypothetical protein